MKAFKIDVVTKEIIEIDCPKGIQSIYEVLQCDTFACVFPALMPDGFTLYVDDEGLYRKPPLGAFSIKGFAQVLSGHGFVVGTDEEGESADAPITLEELKAKVRFEDTHYLPELGFHI